LSKITEDSLARARARTALETHAGRWQSSEAVRVGLMMAHLLERFSAGLFDVTLFEATPRLGGKVLTTGPYRRRSERSRNVSLGKLIW
jgi:Flavin containing amine oxidoreductase